MCLAGAGQVERVVVNNAGYGFLAAVEEVTDAEARATFDVQVFGVWNVLRAALLIFRAQRSGHVINVSSILGLTTFPGWGLYCAGKYAFEGLTGSLAAEVADFDIKVNLVEPGYLRTDFLLPHSLGLPSAATDSYPAIREMTDAHLAMPGTQLGDPAKAAAAIIEIATSADAPLHQILGSDSYALATAQVKELAADFETAQPRHHDRYPVRPPDLVRILLLGKVTAPPGVTAGIVGLLVGDLRVEAKITPEDVGLTAYGARQVPGLRREEVATLAGVSVDYYNRMERGNLAGVSEGVLEAVAGALRLDEAERAHLFDLVGELSTKCEEFAALWATHNVRLHRKTEEHFNHPVVGDLTLRYERLAVDGDPGLEIFSYVAEPGSRSEESFNFLASCTADGNNWPSQASVKTDA